MGAMDRNGGGDGGGQKGGPQTVGSYTDGEKNRYGVVRRGSEGQRSATGNTTDRNVEGATRENRPGDRPPLAADSFDIIGPTLTGQAQAAPLTPFEGASVQLPYASLGGPGSVYGGSQNRGVFSPTTQLQMQLAQMRKQYLQGLYQSFLQRGF